MLEETNKLWKLADRRTGMNILICDDERFAAEKIAELVSRSAVQHHLAVSVVKYTDVEKCLASPLNRCDIAFFDIDMKPYNGIDLARKLHNENPNAIIIFVTNYIEYAPAGYEVNAFRYLLKPEIDKNFERIFEDALEAYKKITRLYRFLLMPSILKCRYITFYILSPNNVLCGCICSKVTELVTDSMRV